MDKVKKEVEVVSYQETRLWAECEGWKALLYYWEQRSSIRRERNMNRPIVNSFRSSKGPIPEVPILAWSISALSFSKWSHPRKVGKSPKWPHPWIVCSRTVPLLIFFFSYGHDPGPGSSYYLKIVSIPNLYCYQSHEVSVRRLLLLFI